MNKTLVIPYFGKFPNYIQLWLDSCGRNPSFSWILITDCEYKDLTIPKNVKIIKSSLKDIENIFKEKIDKNIQLKSPYKLCDFRVVYWMLLDYYQIEYDYWGYCDMDLIFGNLATFITDDILLKYDKILTNGHLSLFNSKPKIKNSYKLQGSKYSFKEVFCNSKNYGFDEHHGVNKIFKYNNFKQYNNLSIIADIDPQFNNFYLFFEPYNEKKQYFSLEDGKILQTFIKNNKYFNREFAYIHIQKRRMQIDKKLDDFQNYLICSNGFAQLNRNKIKNFRYKKENFKNKFKRLRTILRFYKHKFSNVI